MQISTYTGVATDGAQPPPDEAVPIRDVHLEHAFADVLKYFADGDIVMSHMFAALSATFPDGESCLAFHTSEERSTDPARQPGRSR